GAVENVIKDLPKLTAAMREAGVRYFADVSDSIAAGPKDKQRDCGATWGLIAALLGSADKRRAFMYRFWFEKSSAEGLEPDPMRLRCLREIVERGEHDALPWPQAAREFKEARQKMLARAAALQSWLELAREIAGLREQVRVGSDRLQALSIAA